MTRPIHFLPILAAIAVLTFTLLPTRAQPGPIISRPPGPLPAQPPDAPKVIVLQLHPAAEPEPALRYQFLPDLVDRTPGNAAGIYETAAHLASEVKDEKDELVTLVGQPLDQLDKARANRLLEPYSNALRSFAIAARRDRCDWDLPVREQGFALLTPLLGSHRKLARAQVLQARLQIGEGEFDQAVRSLQNCFALSRDLAKGPTLIQALVGTSIAAVTLNAAQELSAQPGAPNLYWALTELPRPLIDVRTAMDFEKSWVFMSMPELARARPEEMTAADYQALTTRITQLMGSGFEEPASHWDRVERPRLAAAAMGVALYPTAKRYLIAQGRTPQEVEAMPVAGVLATYQLGIFAHHRDNLFKWFGVPYSEAVAGMAAAERELQADVVRGEGAPFIQILPSLGSAYRSVTRLDQQIALLRCVEALRLYAAAHGGKLPAALDQITQVPIPNDPMSGKPFPYTVDGNRATLEAPAAAGRPQREGVRYEITVAK